jgi:ATP-dependent DNA helicase PIF1
MILGLITSGSSLFLTGKAGTGKSTFLKYLRATTTKEMAVVAPTGLAAVNVEGQTVHSLFSFPPRLIDPAKVQIGRNGNVLKRLDLLIVDEVSMVRVDLLDGIDRCMRLCKRCLDLPFGGVQVVLIGDVFQLPPIVREQELKKYFAEL